MISPKERLTKMLEREEIPHALLFAGPKGSGKSDAALAFAHSLVGSQKKYHPDIHLYYPEGKTGMHAISSIRTLTHDVSLAPYESKWKMFIIHEAERMLPTSSNALLKTFEEPPTQTIFILISHHPERLLPTILSRCQTIEFLQPKKEEASAILLDVLGGRAPKEQLKEIEADNPETLFETILFWYRDRMLLEIGGSQEYLHFPERLLDLKRTPFIPVEDVERMVKQARLAFERSTKLSTCLEMLLLFLMHVNTAKE